jgi:AcrR family transcriptional regulator
MTATLESLKHRDFAGTENLILSAYLRLCAKKGISSVTLQMIALEAKLAFATVRYHFAEKDVDLEQAATIYVAKRGQRFTQEYIDKESARANYNPIRAYLDATFDWIKNCPTEANFLMHFYYLSGTQVNIVFHNDELIATARRRVLALLREAIGMKLIPSISEPEAIARQIHAVVFGTAVMAMSTAPSNEFTKIRNMAWAIIQKILPSN